MKMWKVIAFILSLGIPGLGVGFAQGVNIELLANIKEGTGDYSDIWGFVDKNGIEYAIIGQQAGIFIYSLEDPTAPIKREFIPLASSIWRDFKSYGNFVYAVDDQGRDGLGIIDMSGAPNDISWKFLKPTITEVNGSDTIFSGTLTKCHNMFIDSSGVMYLSDCQGVHRGVIFFDLKSDPQSPTYLGYANPNVCHDVVVRNDTMYTSDIFAGYFSIIDVRDKSNPVLLGTQPTTFSFTHNAWISDDGEYLFTTDEQPTAYVQAYRVSDPTDIQFLDQYRPVNALQKSVYPHNVHFFNDFLVTSYYTDGVVILDVSKPDNMIEVASYDTYPDAHGGFNGCWGAYPYLPSGILLASDINYGLFVLKPRYVKAGRMEGHVTDRATGDFLKDVKVNFLGSKIVEERTDANGRYQTGLSGSGSFQVEFYHPEYHTKILDVVITEGGILLQNVELEAKPIISINGTIKNSVTGLGIDKAQITLKDRELEIIANSDQHGSFTFNAFSGDYEIYAGKWGYHTIELSQAIMADNQIEIELNPGYRDEFVMDLGWQVTGDASRGYWVRAIPLGTSFQNVPSNPDQDLPDDLGEYCYVTGNGSGSVGAFDVDQGSVVLTSPFIDISVHEDPVLSLSVWFKVLSGTMEPNDTLQIGWINRNDTIPIDQITQNTTGWELKKYNLKEILGSTTSGNLVVIASDLPGTGFGHVVEAGIDGFSITEGSSTSIFSPAQNYIQWSVFPNPFKNRIHINYQQKGKSVSVNFVLMNHLGQRIFEKTVLPGEVVFLNEKIVPGIYFGLLESNIYSTPVIKLIKAD